MKKDNIIIVAYINVSHISCEEAEYAMTEFARVLEDGNDGSINYYVIPIRDGETRIECINPVLVGEELYSKVREAAEEAKERLDNFMKNKEE